MPRSTYSTTLPIADDDALEVSTSHGDPGRITLTLRVEHRPLGAADALVDRALARRLTTATFERVLGELAERLQELLATAELSSDLRVAPALAPPTLATRAVRFDADAPVRTPLHADADHRVAVVGFEPWQAGTVAAHDATVTLVVVEGRGRLVSGRTTLELAPGEVAIVPAGADADLSARGQRMTVIEHVVAVASPVSAPPADAPAVVVTA